MISDGLTGHTREFEWDRAWLDDHWLAASGVGSGSFWGDLKTVLRLYDGRMNLLREVEIVPYSY